ncbi:MAG: anhydro-N-acetylmuramic acid kinase [Chloroflexota bacterium]|nr:anhydro-N-acetylmuramic acid kinase [Chloroflexota bacterium]
MLVLGLISGTSLDAIDAALVEITTRHSALELSLVSWAEAPWPAELRDRLRGWSDPAATLTAGDLAVASMAVGEAFATAALDLAHEARVASDQVDLVVSHGQTIHHRVDEAGRAVATLQIGEPAVLAERTGRTVVADLRSRDIAAGGQGAPLVGYLDALLLGEPERTVAALNIGGIANLTIIPAGRAFDSIAFDTGPGNAIIDASARELLGQPLDRDGATAAAGAPSEALLDVLLRQPYFHRPPPKSTGRELFGDAYAAQLIGQGRALGLADDDLLATATELTARTVSSALTRWAPDWPEVLYVAGGGTRNGALMAGLRRALARETPAGATPVALKSVDEVGLPQAAKEAVCFAVLGHEALHGRPNSLPGCTGARHPSVLGAIWPGTNYLELLERVARSRKTAQPIDRIDVRHTSGDRKGA